MNGLRQTDRLGRGADIVLGLTERYARREIERNRDRGKQSLVINGERGGFRLVARQRAQRHPASRWRTHIHLLQKLGTLQKFRRRLHHHVILIQRRIHGRNLSLAKCIVKRIVDQLRCDVETRRRSPVVGHHRLQTLVLQVAVDIGDTVQGFQLFQHFGRISDQIGQIIPLHGVLILGVARPSADTHILRRLQIQAGPRHLGQLRPQPPDDLVGERVLSLTKRLQRNEHSSRIGAAREPQRIRDSGVRFDNRDHALQYSVKSLKGRVLIRLDGAHHAPVILLRKEPFRHAHEQVHIQPYCRQQHQQSNEGMLQHARQRPSVELDNRLEESLAGAIEPAVYMFFF